MLTHRQARFGLSLLELIVVMTLMGIFSSAAFMRFGRDIFGDSGARSEARSLSVGLLHAQRAAIRTGDRHGVMLHGSTSNVKSWSVVQERLDGSTVVVDGPHAIPDEVVVAASASAMWFDFEGAGSQMFLFTLTGPNRQYEIKVEALTRMIRSREVKR